MGAKSIFTIYWQGREFAAALPAGALAFGASVAVGSLKE